MLHCTQVRVRVSKWLKELEEYFYGSCVAYDAVRLRSQVECPIRNGLATVATASPVVCMFTCLDDAACSEPIDSHVFVIFPYMVLKPP
jgi:hypothetical protein